MSPLRNPGPRNPQSYKGLLAKLPQVCPGVRQHLYHLVQETICPLPRKEILSLSSESVSINVLKKIVQDKHCHNTRGNTMEKFHLPQLYSDNKLSRRRSESQRTHQEDVAVT